MLAIGLAMLYVYIVLYITILIHECGHAVANTICGIKVRGMQIGIGPTLFRFGVKHCKIIKLRLIPIAGAVEIRPEKFDELDTLDQVFIFSAGIIGNFITAVISLVCVGETVLDASVGTLRQVFSLLFKFFDHVVATLRIWDTSSLSNVYVGTGYWILDGIIAINIAVIAGNLLPLPPLDGGQICMSWAAKIFPREIVSRVRPALEIIGFVYLILVFIIQLTQLLFH